MVNMPSFQAERFAPIRSIFKGPCDDKHDVLSHYKFTIVFENTAYPGHVTEKVTDAMVASSIPVYLGAPDIALYLPARSFIDVQAFDSMEDVATHMEKVSESDATAAIEAGQEFLQSSQGQRYTYEGFGEFIVSLAHGEEIDK
jgi:hypothetical protein